MRKNIWPFNSQSIDNVAINCYIIVSLLDAYVTDSARYDVDILARVQFSDLPANLPFLLMGSKSGPSSKGYLEGCCF